MNELKALTCTATAALLLACGGCGSDESSTTPAPTKDEFIAAANEICGAGDAEIQQATQQLDSSASDEELEQFVTDTAIPVIEDERDQLDELGAPEGDEEEVDAILNGLDDAIAAVKADPGSALSDSGPFDEVNQLAQDYGLTDCGNGA